MRDELLREGPLKPAIEAVLRRASIVVALACSACGATSPPPVVVIPKVDASTSVRRVDGDHVALRAPTPASIRWLTDDREASELARTTHRPLLVFAGADWAAPTARMDRDVWSDPRVRAKSVGFVMLRLDLTETDVDAEARASRFGVDRIPSVIVFDTTGARVAADAGLTTIDAILAAMDRASD